MRRHRKVFEYFEDRDDRLIYHSASWSSKGKVDQPVGTPMTSLQSMECTFQLIGSKGRVVGSGSTPSNLRPSNVVYHWQATFKGNYLLVYSPDGVFRMCVRTLTCPKDSVYNIDCFSFGVDSPHSSFSQAQGDVGSNSNGQWNSAERHKEQGSIAASVVLKGFTITGPRPRLGKLPNCFPCLFPSSGAKVQEHVDGNLLPSFGVKLDPALRADMVLQCYMIYDFQV